MDRSLQPEILDQLTPQEPEAIRSRRDLRLINNVMGNTQWLHDRLDAIVRPGERVLELGAGEGALAQYWRSTWDGLDLWPRPKHWPVAAKWHQLDVMRFGNWAEYPVVFASLFFHQFSDQALQQIGERLRQHVRVVIACEPVRSRMFQAFFAALCPVIGAGPVTRHDGRVSIAAGFRSDELARKLGLIGPRWKCRLQQTWRGAYRFIAVRA